MIRTFVDIVQSKWKWRKQVLGLSRFELLKRSKDSVLSWAWLVIKPLVTVFCYWFTLYIGFRHGHTLEGLPPYILWLVAGVIPWFFMSEILNGGTDLLHTYNYLVKKVPFPLATIPSIYVLTSFIVQLILQVVLLGVYFACGLRWDIHLIQVPILLVLMFIFWDTLALLFSLLSAVNRGVNNLIRALSTPIFWLSGIIFNMEDISLPWLRHLLYLNPVTFFASAFRKALYYRTWVWDRPWQLAGFALSFVFVLVVTTVVYRWLYKEVPDVL